MARDVTALISEMATEYESRTPRSAALNKKAVQVLVDGGSHALRLVRPYPPRIITAKGAWIRDEDGHDILDFWQGHFANILGHNPEVITHHLARVLEEGNGLQTGFTEREQIHVAEALTRQTGYERVRFTTSGTLATMYAIMLARAYTGRNLVLKAGGGWHGANPWGLKGTKWSGGFDAVDSAGIPAAMSDEVLITRFNDPQHLEDTFRRHGDRLACLILEPVMGAGGLIPARTEFLKLARDLASRYGALLVFDEVITGFRYRAGDVGELYGVKGDIAVFGKIIGGGMPVAAVAGRTDIMELTGRSTGPAVKFSGGTYSGHPASMIAAAITLDHLVQNEAAIYPHIAQVSRELRRVVVEAFFQKGIHARFTGDLVGDLPDNSLHMLVFPLQPELQLETPEEVYDPELCDLELGEEVLPLAMMLEDVFTVHGLGSTSAAHHAEDLFFLERAVTRVAERIKPVYRGL